MEQIEELMDTAALSSAQIQFWGRGREGSYSRGVHFMRILREFIMTELVKAKLLRVPAKFSRPCNGSFHLYIIRISLAVALVVAFHVPEMH